MPFIRQNPKYTPGKPPPENCFLNIEVGSGLPLFHMPYRFEGWPHPGDRMMVSIRYPPDKLIERIVIVKVEWIIEDDRLDVDSIEESLWDTLTTS